jgi:CrcB protein
MTVLLIAVGAAVGAPARYLTDRAIQSRHDTVFPWGTLSVNLLACLLLGVLAGAAVSRPVTDLLGTGFCGALSTYSTFSYETVHLAQRGARFHAVANAAVSIVGGIGAAALGWSIGLAVR